MKFAPATEGFLPLHIFFSQLNESAERLAVYGTLDILPNLAQTCWAIEATCRADRPLTVSHRGVHGAGHSLLHAKDVAHDMVCERAGVPLGALAPERHILSWQVLAPPVQEYGHAHMLVLQQPAPHKPDQPCQHLYESPCTSRERLWLRMLRRQSAHPQVCRGSEGTMSLLFTRR